MERWSYEPEKYLNGIKPIPFEILEKCSKKKNAICKITEKLINFKDINKWNNWVIDKLSYFKNNEIQIGSKIEVEHEEKKLTLQ